MAASQPALRRVGWDAREGQHWQSLRRRRGALRSLFPACRGGQPGRAHLRPHRGVIILVLGILGCSLGCCVFGVIAWAMAAADLREMRAGRMDNSGRGMTLAGMILGIIQVVLMTGYLAISILIRFFH